MGFLDLLDLRLDDLLFQKLLAGLEAGGADAGGLKVDQLVLREDARAVGAAQLGFAALGALVGGGAFLAPVAAEMILETGPAGEAGAADVAGLLGRRFEAAAASALIVHGLEIFCR